VYPDQRSTFCLLNTSRVPDNKSVGSASVVTKPQESLLSLTQMSSFLTLNFTRRYISFYGHVEEQFSIFSPQPQPCDFENPFSVLGSCKMRSIMARSEMKLQDQRCLSCYSRRSFLSVQIFPLQHFRAFRFPPKAVAKVTMRRKRERLQMRRQTPTVSQRRLNTCSRCERS